MSTPYKAYTRASHTVSKPRQVVMLYEGVIRLLQHAKEASGAHDSDVHYTKLSKASDILLALQSALDLSVYSQEALALDAFYRTMDARIISLHRTRDLAEYDALIAELRTMRDVWDQLDRKQNPASPH